MEYLADEEREQYEQYGFSEDERKKLLEYDYFGKEDLFSKQSEIQSIPAWGKRGTAPLVSIILTTYKRPALLEEALMSALHQEEFEDYEIVICDNEGAPLEMETETSALIRRINDPKIIYYRHSSTIINNFDRGARLAEGEWICFLHDDDLLSPEHLKIMTGIIKKHPEIDWLSCLSSTFHYEKKEPERIPDQIKIIKRNKKRYAFWFDGDWQGALIRRKNYIDMGGFPSQNSGMADYVMTAKYAYYYNHYVCDALLYFTRIWEGQDSARSNGLWLNICIKEFFFYCYAVNKYFFTANLFRSFWKRLCLFQIQSKMKLLERGSHGIRIRYEVFCRLVGERERNFSKIEKFLFLIITGYYKKNRIYCLF